MSVKTKRVQRLCDQIADEHAKDRGVIVVSARDYVELWSEIESELRPFRKGSFKHFDAISVKDKAVIQRDEHEGAPRWANEAEVSTW